MIHVIATIETAAGKQDEFLEIFRRLVPTVRAEAGCLEYGPTVDAATDVAPARANVVTVVERWESVDALRAHLAAPHMAAFRADVQELVVDLSIRVLQPI